MLLSPTTSIRFLGILLYSLYASFSSLAQALPTWQSARATGPGSAFLTNMAVDAAGNTYEVGSFATATAIDGTVLLSQGNTDGYLAKYTPTGSLAWVRQLGSSGPDLAQSVALDAAGNAYVSGYFTGSITLSTSVGLNGGTSSLRKAFVARFSPQGTPQWAQQSAATASASTAASGIGTDALGHVYVVGLFTTTVTLGTTTLTVPNATDAVFIARLSALTGVVETGTPAFTYGPPTGTTTALSAPEVAVAATGEVFVLSSFSQPAVLNAGTTFTSRGDNDVLVAKYTALGTFDWARQFGGAADDLLRQGVVDTSGNLYVVGLFTGSATFGTSTVFGAGSYDGYLVKYSPQGTLAWVQPSGGPNTDALSGVSLDGIGNPYVVGSFSGTTRFGSTMLTSAGNGDIAVAAYSPQGQLRWVQRAGGPNTDRGNYIGVDAAGTIYVMGNFLGVCTLGTVSLTATSPNLEWLLACLSTTPLAVRPHAPLTIGLYPNPASTSVHLLGVPVGSCVQLVDGVGRTVHTTRVAAEARVALDAVAPGLYGVRATDSQGGQYTGRLVIE